MTGEDGTAAPGNGQPLDRTPTAGLGKFPSFPSSPGRSRTRVARHSRRTSVQPLLSIANPTRHPPAARPQCAGQRIRGGPRGVARRVFPPPSALLSLPPSSPTSAKPERLAVLSRSTFATSSVLDFSSRLTRRVARHAVLQILPRLPRTHRARDCPSQRRSLSRRRCAGRDSPLALAPSILTVSL